MQLKITFVIVYTCILNAQQLADTQMEIFCGSENYAENLQYNLTPIGMTWNVAWPTPYTKVFTIDTDGTVDGGAFTAEPNVPIYCWKGYNYLPSSESGGCGGFNGEDFGFGIYKLAVADRWIFLDWRDTRYGSYSTCDGHCADIWIKYDGNSGKMHIKSDATFIWSGGVSNGELFTIWQLKDQGSPSTLDAPLFWQNCLVLIPSPDNHPRLVWGPHPTFSATHYRIYRAVSNYPVNPSSLTYSLISTVSS